MAKQIPLRYVGKKPAAYDNIARSGKTWNGHGDVQLVTDAQAKLLLKFPDQWALEDQSDAPLVESPESLTVTDADGQDVSIDPVELKKPYEKMNKTELKALAKDKWGKDLDLRKSTKDLIDQVEEWDRDLNVTIGKVE